MFLSQVHYLVRQNLLELDQIREEHDDILKELQGCYGIERCLKEFNLLGYDTRKTSNNFINMLNIKQGLGPTTFLAVLYFQMWSPTSELDLSWRLSSVSVSNSRGPMSAWSRR